MAGPPGWVGGGNSGATERETQSGRQRRFGPTWPTGPLVANPDFYTSVLWKRMMGPRIFALDVKTAEPAGIEPPALSVSLSLSLSLSRSLARSLSPLTLRLTVSGGGNRKIRFAAACARSGGGVVVAYSNPTPDATFLTVTAAAHTRALLSTPRREWCVPD